MAVSTQIRSRSCEGKTQTVYGKFTFSGNYPPGGEPVPKSSLRVGGTTNPLRSLISGANQKYVYMYDDVNDKVIVRDLTATEIAGGAYPALVSGDVVEFMIVFRKF
jgi:hypothetical protein